MLFKQYMLGTKDFKTHPQFDAIFRVARALDQSIPDVTGSGTPPGCTSGEVKSSACRPEKLCLRLPVSPPETNVS